MLPVRHHAVPDVEPGQFDSESGRDDSEKREADLRSHQPAEEWFEILADDF